MTITGEVEGPDDWFEDDEPDDLEEDCGLTPDGLCQNAGTEWCDWSCPFNGERNANRIRKMKSKTGNLL